jgi:hypothetical protein
MKNNERQSSFVPFPFPPEEGPENGGGSRFLRAIVFGLAGVDPGIHSAHDQPQKVGRFYPGNTL